MSAKDIYETIKEGDNKKNWAISQELAEFRRKAAKQTNRSSVDIDFSDRKALQTEVMSHLYTESGNGNAQASAQLAKIARLGEESQDIIIEVVDFANAYEENTVTTTETEVLPNKQLESLGSGCEESTD
tara:strand:+ start:84 stop:470 length:387 start_codon:yes stop_codon:yes gene_type:complete